MSAPESSRLEAVWLFEDYVQSLRAARRSPATIRAYRSDLEHFVAWSRPAHVVAPRDVTTRVLRDYLTALTTNGDARSSLARRRASLR
ncbi:MAG TPA: site-specific integrase, partial [Acidimicrobiales bacterium]|nr:site-specific integrase [Acidimicrobiales bacterium]